MIKDYRNPWFVDPFRGFESALAAESMASGLAVPPVAGWRPSRA